MFGEIKLYYFRLKIKIKLTEIKNKTKYSRINVIFIAHLNNKKSSFLKLLNFELPLMIVALFNDTYINKFLMKHIPIKKLITNNKTLLLKLVTLLIII